MNPVYGFPNLYLPTQNLPDLTASELAHLCVQSHSDENAIARLLNELSNRDLSFFKDFLAHLSHLPISSMRSLHFQLLEHEKIKKRALGEKL